MRGRWHEGSICGPVFRDELGRRLPERFIGDGTEVRVAVPQHFYKIVARLSASDPARPEVLAYLFPHDPELRSGAKDQDLSGFLVSVDTLELLTGLDFFTNLPDDVEAVVEQQAAAEEWPLRSP